MTESKMIKTTQEYKIHSFGALHLLPEVDDKSVDLIITDLPYEQTKNKWDIIISPSDLWNQYTRIIKNDGVVLLFGQGLFTAVMMQSNIDMWKYNLIWNKVLKTGHLNAELIPLRQHEDIMVFSGKNSTYNPQKIKGNKNHSKNTKSQTNNNYGAFDNVDNSIELGNMKYPGSILKFQKPHPSICIHPTQKPLKLIEYLIKTYSNVGDVVHDSCLGSGVTLEACMNTNRNCFGFEKVNEWEYNYKKCLRLGNSKLTDDWGSCSPQR